MSDSSKPKSGGGCFVKLVVLFLLAAGSGLVAAVVLAFTAQDLTDIGGYGPPAKGATSRDLGVVLKNSVERGYAVTLTEAELNQWLARTLALKQGGLLGGRVSLDRVWVRLHDGHAEIIMERTLKGRPITVSMFLRIEQIQELRGVKSSISFDGGPFHPSVPVPPRGGRFGRLVVPQGFLHLTVPAYRKLGACFLPEKQLIEQMARIRIEKGRIVLDPTEPSGDPLRVPMTF